MPDNKGYVINDPNYGTILIGSDKNVKKVERSRQVQIASASLASIKLYDDGGFEIASGNGGEKQKSDNIYSQSRQGLVIKNDGHEILIDAGDTGTIRLHAGSIILDAVDTNDSGITIRSASNITIDAADNIAIEGSQVAIGAKYKMFIGTAGPFILRGKGGVSIVEPKSKLIPTSVNDVIDKVLELVFPEYF